MREKLNCPNCGAPITGTICQYCGAVFYDFAAFELGKPTYVRVKHDGIYNVFRAMLTDATLEVKATDTLFPTMDLIHIQNQGIEEGVKSAATYRFMAKVNNFSKAEDLKKEMKRFTEENFAKEAEGGGLLLFPNTYTDIKQIDVKPWVVDADQMKVIRDNVFEYFGLL